METESSVRERIESVRAMIHELDEQDYFDGVGKALATQVDEELRALSDSLAELDETPLFI